jgi:hypothetical protein
VTALTWVQATRPTAKSFGAKGDATADDTAAVQACTTAAASAGGVCELETATGYLVGPVTIPSGVTLRGAGRAAPLMQKTINTTGVGCSGADGVAIENVYVQAQAGDASGNGIRLINCTRASVSNSTIVGFGGSGIRWDGGDTLDVEPGTVIDGTGATVTPNTNAIYLAPGNGHQTSVRIIGTDLGETGQGVASNGVPLSSFLFVGNTVHDISGPNAQHGTYVGAETMTISGNVVKNVSLCGMKVFPYSPRDTGQFTVVGNTVDGGWGKHWTAATKFGKADYIRPLVPADAGGDGGQDIGYLYRATSAGTSGSTDPSWPSTLGATVADGSVTWTNWGTHLLGAGAGIEMDGPSGNVFTAHGIAIVGNTIQNFSGYGISTGDLLDQVEIASNPIYNVGAAAIISQQTISRLNIHDNLIENAALIRGHGIQLSPDSSSGANVWIHHNQTSGIGNGYSIYASNTAGLRVEHNWMLGTAPSGALALISNIGTVQIRDNIADDSTTYGVTTVCTDRNSWDTCAGYAPLICTYAQGDTTPSVLGCTYIHLWNVATDDAGTPVQITEFRNSVEGQTLFVSCGDGSHDCLTTITRYNAYLPSAANLVLTRYSGVVLQMHLGAWRVLGYSNTNG